MPYRSPVSCRAMTRNRLAAVVAVLAVLVFPAVAVAAKNGTYVGKDEGKVKVTLKIKHNRVTFFKGNPSGYCYGIGTTFVAFKYPSAAQRPSASSKIKKSGVFTAVFKGSPDVSFKDDQRTLTGKVKGRKVSGRMIVSGLCQADQKFTATRK
jgi:hypothetical protein